MVVDLIQMSLFSVAEQAFQSVAFACRIYKILFSFFCHIFLLQIDFFDVFFFLQINKI